MLTEEEKKRTLDYETFQAEIDRIRREPERKWWESAALMTLLTAVLTAIVTIFGGYLTQYLSRSNEFSLEVAKTELGSKREFLKETYTILSTLLKADEDRLALAQGKYDSLSEKKRREISEATNEADNTWRIKKAYLEFQIFLYYGKTPDIVNAWKETSTAIQSYGDCIEKTFDTYQSSNAPADSCKKEAELANQANGRLRDKITSEYREQVFR